MEKKSTVSVNGILKPSENAFISALDQGMQFGWGLFETIRVYTGKIFLLDEHIKRMYSSATQLSIPIKMNTNELANNLQKFVDHVGLYDMVLKIILTRGNGEASNIIFTHREVSYTNEDYKRGFTVKIASVRRNETSPLSLMKTLNYMDNIMAKRDAEKSGNNEALFLNTSGKLCEGSMSNVFFVKNNKLYTPKVECGILPGITRKVLIEKLAPVLKIELEEGEYELQDILEAEEAFLTNSVMEIMPISFIGDKRIGDMNKNILTTCFIEEYKKYTEKTK
jgi:aminodeoxychorismate lyase